MTVVPLHDPLSVAFAGLRVAPLPVPKGIGQITPSQRKKLEEWNSRSGIRAQAAQARFITSEENRILRQALYHWPWMDPSGARKNVNRIIAMLFYTRCNFGLAGTDRAQLSTVSQFVVRRVHQPSPWPRRGRRSRGSFLLLG